MNRVVMIVLVFVVIAIWFSAFANACGPSTGYAGGGPSWVPPIIVGSGGWNRGGWDRGSGSSSPSFPSPGRSGGGSSTRGGGITGGMGGK